MEKIEAYKGKPIRHVFIPRGNKVRNNIQGTTGVIINDPIEQGVKGVTIPSSATLSKKIQYYCIAWENGSWVRYSEKYVEDHIEDLTHKAKKRAWKKFLREHTEQRKFNQ